MDVSNGIGTLAAISCPIVIEYLTPKGIEIDLILLNSIFVNISLTGSVEQWWMVKYHYKTNRQSIKSNLFKKNFSIK